MKKIIILSFFVFSIALASCSDSQYEYRVPQDPEATILLKPDNNTECLEVEAVKFEWSKSVNTDIYTIVVTNLLSKEIITQTSTSPTKEITLVKGKPYSWQVTSSNSMVSKKAKSEIWKFYLSGEALKNHAPFPAEILTPIPGSSVSSGSISLSCSFSDIDANDTHSFDLFLDQDGDDPATKKIVSNYGARKRTVSLTTPGVYYWRVVTKDNHGTSSDSGISTFTVLE